MSEDRPRVALLDVNVLVALFDGAHTHHEVAHEWFAAQRELGWATCPLTENGFVRVLSNPAYPGRGTTLRDAIARLSAFRASGRHSFWPDEVSLCEDGLFDPTHIAGNRQLTDVYLLGLSVHHGGRLATFDSRIRRESVRRAGSEHLVLIGDSPGLR
jgi:toxin-antitoxin system PIN domain toxin